MAITLTTRLSTAFAGGTAQTATSGAFTPSANSTLYVAVYIVALNDGTTYDDIIETSNTGGLTFARVAQSAFTGGGNAGRVALFEAAVGGSPSSMTVTFDLDSGGTEACYTWIGAFDAVGSVAGVNIKSGQIITKAELDSGGSAESHASGTLPSAVTTGNTAVMLLGRNNDSDGAAATPSGWTDVFNPTGSYISGVCFKKTDFTGTSVTVTDCGEAVQSTGSVLFELEEGGEPPPPIPVEYVSQGAAVAGTTAITTAAYGTGWADGDLGVCVVATGHSTANTPTVAGFDNVGGVSGGTGSFAAGTGPRRLTFFTRTLVTGDDTTPAIDLAGASTMIAAITIFKHATGYTWETAVSAFGAEDTAGTSWSAAMTTDPGFDAEDMLIGACAVCDSSGSTAEGFSATGATFSALTERVDLSSETGNDLALHVATADVLTGPSSAVGTRTATHSTSDSGMMGVLRIRATSASGDFTGTSSLAGTDAITGAGVVGKVATATRTATATVAASGVVGKLAAAALAATAALTGVGAVGVSSGASLAATATVTASGVVGTSSGATLSATDSIAATGTMAAAGSSSIAATDTLTSSGTVGTVSTVTLTATGTIAAAGSVGGGALSTDATLSATDTVTATGQVGTVAGATLAETAAITSAGVVGRTSSATLAASDTVAGSGVVGTSATSSLTATGTISVAGVAGSAGTGSAALAETGTITATGTMAASRSASLAATDALSATGSVGKVSSASVAATGALTASSLVGKQAAASVAATATITAAGTVAGTSTASLAATATVTAAGQVGTSSTAAIAATATIGAAGLAEDPSGFRDITASATMVRLWSAELTRHDYAATTTRRPLRATLGERPGATLTRRWTARLE